MYFCVVLYIVCFVTFSVLFVCICVLSYCYRVATQLQLYHIIYYTMNDIHDTIVSRKKLYVNTLTHKTNKSALTFTAHIPALRGYC
jgi:hypothetical protein